MLTKAYRRWASSVRLRCQLSTVNLPQMRVDRKDEISKLNEVIQREKFLSQLKSGCGVPNIDAVDSFARSNMDHSTVKSSLTAAMTTFALHVEARIASSLGVGFYTIGPCGEELLAAVGSIMRDTDASALHYRHVATAVARQMKSKSLQDIILDRSRGYTCSTLDPVTGGKHCAIGGSPYDFVVTSTLASQAPPAVGRALGISLSNFLLKDYATDMVFPADSVSYVSVGDGSVNNAHFLASLNLAEYAQHRKFKCPVVFGISNNNVCISLKNYGWLPQFLKKYEQNNAIKTFQCDGNNLFDIYYTAKKAFDYSRKLSKPSIIVYNNISRRFGHAATDRQAAYLTPTEIDDVMNHNAILTAISDAVANGIVTFEEAHQELTKIIEMVETAFDTACNEPKIDSVSQLVDSNSAPVVTDASTGYCSVRPIHPTPVKNMSAAVPKTKLEPMRKQMTRVFDEILAKNQDVVYIGEDVQHGGYYLVTDGLASKYPMRVCDFPPDETTLVGAGIGYSQAGFTPIVEIPYSKYLDCASDMFYEMIISNWLTNGKQPNGVLVRLQGFDKGVFGGNYHTHNVIPLACGLDVVCYSNGADYVRGMRYALKQVRNGRVVMSVDSTDLLNRRHVDISAKDNGMLSHYPEDSDEISFDNVILYQGNSISNSKEFQLPDIATLKLVIVTYGNGVPTTLLAVKQLMDESMLTESEVLVIDSPYLSDVPNDLLSLFQHIANDKEKSESIKIIFADVCKESGNMPLNGYVQKLNKKHVLPSHWTIVAAANTYNPLSRTLTFLNETDIVNAVKDMWK